jgi:7-carboxy-7-deazaguanine synthase
MFHAFQGEGVHMGRSAFFIRLFGCPLHCPFCDSAGTWHPTYAPKPVRRLQISEIVDTILNSSPLPQIIVVTGGEPGAFNLFDLTQLIKNSCSIPIHVETSGAFPIKGDFDWITVSPKKGEFPLCESAGEAANEFKLIIETPDDVDYWVNFVLPHTRSSSRFPSPTVWLHPEWSQRNNPDVLSAIAKGVIKYSWMNVRAGYQIHKLYKCDALDSRSVAPAPLGGDTAKGY